jgi:hypothetical protein
MYFKTINISTLKISHLYHKIEYIVFSLRFYFLKFVIPKLFERLVENGDRQNIIKTRKFNRAVNCDTSNKNESEADSTERGVLGSSTVVNTGAITPKRNSLHETKNLIACHVLTSYIFRIFLV